MPMTTAMKAPGPSLLAEPVKGTALVYGLRGIVPLPEDELLAPGRPALAAGGATPAAFEPAEDGA